VSLHTIALMVLLPVTAPVPKGGEHPTAVLGDRSPGKVQKENDWFLQYHAKQLKSREVLEAALRKPGVAGLLPLGLEEDPMAWVKQRLKTEVEPKHNRFKVWVETRDLSQRNKAALVNALADALIAEIAAQERRPKEEAMKGWLRDRPKYVNMLEGALEQARKRGATPQDAEWARRYQREIEAGDRKVEQLRKEIKEPPRITFVERAQPQP
jgi:hypothetical protein